MLTSAIDDTCGVTSALNPAVKVVMGPVSAEMPTPALADTISGALCVMAFSEAAPGLSFTDVADRHSVDAVGVPEILPCTEP
jgi:hypothetical protein